ncbi:hypothetical protein D3C87_2075130 [compost metagenome]
MSGKVWGGEAAQKFSDKQIKVMQDFNLRLANQDLYDSAVVPSAEGLFIAVKKF